MIIMYHAEREMYKLLNHTPILDNIHEIMQKKPAYAHMLIVVAFVVVKIFSSLIIAS